MGNYRFNEAKELAIWQWVDRVLSPFGVTTIWDKQSAYGSNNAEKPPLPIAVLNVISGPNNQGTPAQKFKSTDVFTFQFKKEFTLSVNIFAGNAYLELANKLIDSLNLPSQRDFLTAGGLAVMSNTAPLDASVLIDSAHEFRVNVDFFFAYGEDIDDTIGQVDTVRIKGTIDNKVDVIDKTI